MITHASRLTAIVVAAALLSLAGCDGSSTPVEQTGFFSLGISDSPINAKKVCIAFTGVELKGRGAPMILPDPAVESDFLQNINLMDHQGSNAAPLLFNEEILAGEYQWLRLAVNADMGGTGGTGDDPESAECIGDASYVTMKDGTTRNLYIPSGAESGLKLVNGITIPINARANYTAEIDLMLSMKDPILPEEQDAKMRPTVRLVNNIDVGTLTGDVTIPEGECQAPMVFVFENDVEPNAIEAADAPMDEKDPIATAMVEPKQNADGVEALADPNEYAYTVGFLLAGEYEAAFTCDGTNFEPAEGRPVTINAGEVTAVPFP